PVDSCDVTTSRTWCCDGTRGGRNKHRNRAPPPKFCGEPHPRTDRQRRNLYRGVCIVKGFVQAQGQSIPPSGPADPGLKWTTEATSPSARCPERAGSGGLRLGTTLQPVHRGGTVNPFHHPAIR